MQPQFRPPILVILLATSSNVTTAETDIGEDFREIPSIAAFLGDAGFGRIHPDAPGQTRQFGRLAGIWETRTELREEDGSWAASAAGLWTWKYVLDGFAVQDLWYHSADVLPDYLSHLERDYLLTSMRTFNPGAGKWQIAWVTNGAGQGPGQGFGRN